MVLSATRALAIRSLRADAFSVTGMRFASRCEGYFAGHLVAPIAGWTHARNQFHREAITLAKVFDGVSFHISPFKGSRAVPAS
jgi:hypothetical protein